MFVAFVLVVAVVSAEAWNAISLDVSASSSIRNTLSENSVVPVPLPPVEPPLRKSLFSTSVHVPDELVEYLKVSRAIRKPVPL